jgi:hypothetical protein
MHYGQESEARTLQTGWRHDFWSGLGNRLALYHRLCRDALFLEGVARAADLAVLFGIGLAVTRSCAVSKGGCKTKSPAPHPHN